MEISFKGKKALVTGATKGIGREIAKQLVRCGADVVAVGRSQYDLDSLKEECPSVRTIQVDLKDWNATRDALRDVDVDLLINNAGTAIVEPILDISENSVDELFAVNVKSVINVTQIVAKSLIKRKTPGSIVNVSSQASLRAVRDLSVYCSTKAAIDAFTKASALEFGPYNIRVNSINPTVVMTDLGRFVWSDPVITDSMRNKIPLKRFAEIDEVVSVVLFLLSDKAGMVNGSCLLIDGGCTAVI